MWPQSLLIPNIINYNQSHFVVSFYGKREKRKDDNIEFLNHKLGIYIFKDIVIKKKKKVHTKRLKISFVIMKMSPKLDDPSLVYKSLTFTTLS